MSSFNVKTLSRTALPRSKRRREAGTAQAAGQEYASTEAAGDWFELRMVEGTDDSPVYYLLTRYGLVSESFVSAGGIGGGGQGGGGGMSAIKVNGRTYRPDPGEDFVTLPDYPSLEGYATEGYVASGYLPLSGGTLTGELTAEDGIKLDYDGYLSNAKIRWLNRRQAEGTGGRADGFLELLKADGSPNAIFGTYGQNADDHYIFIGYDEYDGANLRISPTGISTPGNIETLANDGYIGTGGTPFAEIHANRWYPNPADSTHYIEYDSANGIFLLHGDVAATGQVLAGRTA